MSDPNAIKLDTGQAASALNQLKESATAVTRAFTQLNAADPKQFMAQMSQLATSVAAMNQDIIKNFATLEKAVAESGRSAAKSARQAGHDMSKALADGLKAGDSEVANTMRAQTKRLQDWYESSTAKGWVFKDSALAQLKAQGVNLGPDIKGEAFNDSLRARSATRMSEDDVRALLGMPDRGEMKTLAASLKSQMQDAMAASTLRAKSATRVNEEDIRTLFGMPARTEMQAFAGSLKAQMQEAMQTSTLRAKSASKMTEEDTRALLGMPSKSEMSSFSASLKAQMTEAVNLEKAQGRLAASKLKTASAANATSSAFLDLTKNSKDLHSAARGLAAGFDAMWLTWGNILPLLAGAAVSTALVKSITDFKDLEHQLKFVQAIAQDTSVSMQELMHSVGTSAIAIGASPLEAAKGLQVLSQAGLSAKEALEVLPTVMRVAKLGELDMADAAATLTGSMNAFGGSIESIGHIGDVFVQAAASSNTSVAQISESMKQASTVAQQYGQSVEDVGVALVALAKRNITGSSAGTAYRNLMDELATPKGEGKKVAAQLGIALFDPLKHTTKDFFETFVPELRQKLEQFNPESQTYILNHLTNNRGGKALSAILGMGDAELADLRTSLQNSTGMASKAMLDLNDSMQGDLNKLKATFTESMGQAAVGGSESLRDSIRRLTEVVASPAFINAVKGLVDVFTMLASAMVSVVSAISSPVGLVSSVGLLVAGLTTAGASAMSAVGAIAPLVATLLRFSVVGVAITAAVTALGYLYAKMSEKSPAEEAAANVDKVIAKQQAYQKELDNTITKLREKLKLEGGGEAKKPDADKRQVESYLALAQNRVAEIQSALSSGGTGRNALSALELASLRKELEGAKAAESSAQHQMDVYKANVAAARASEEKQRQLEAKLANRNREANAAKGEGLKAGEGVFTLDPTVKARNGLPRDNELQTIKSLLASKESEIKSSYDNERKLLELDHKYKLVSEGEYQARVLKDTLDFEDELGRARVSKRVDYDIAYNEAVDRAHEAVKKGALKPENLSHELDQLSNNRKAFLAEQDAKDVELLGAAETRRAQAVRIMAGEVRLAGEAADLYVAKMNRELDAESDLIKVKREHAKDTPIERARYEAEQAFLAKHATEVANLTKKYQDLVRAAEDMRKELGPMPASSEAAGALFDADAAAGAAKSNVDKVKADVGQGATTAGKHAADAIKDQTNALKGARKAFTDYRDTANNVFDSVRASSTKLFQGMTDDIFQYTKTGKLDMDHLTQGILDDLLKISIQRSITTPMGDFLSSGIGAFANFLFSANGNAFGPGGLIPFAKGGVFDSPTAFGFGGGQLGVLGEAGPEAVVPLQRGANGQLGLATGGTSVSLTVNIIEDSSKAGTTSKRKGDNGGDVLDVFVEKVKSSLASDIARGDGAVPNALSTTYGLNRVAGST